MSREIKFRAKDIKTGEWVYGWYVSGNYIPELENYKRGCIMHFGRLQGALKTVEVGPETRGEYTGLKDKNGREIYEGDIVRSSQYPDEVFQVVYEIGTNSALSSFEFRSIGQGISSVGMVEDDGCANGEVIGNVHENPDMLEGNGRRA